MLGRPATKRKDGLKRQSEIMAAALELFAEKGYTSTSIDDIVEAAGTARGTFYLHFHGKSDLFAMVVESYLGELDAIIETLDISMDKPADELRQFYRDAVRLFADIPAVKHFVKVMLQDAMGMETQIRVQTFFEKVTRISERYIARAQEAGRVAPDLDPLALSVCIVGSVKEMLLRWIAVGGSFDLPHAVDTAIAVYFRGMLVESPGPREGAESR